MTSPASRMTSGARALMLAAAILLGGLYVTPLWRVRLVAPQYPEGIGMDIRLNTIEGMKEHDLRNINSLNKYIGMRAIDPDAIPELKLMPWIVAGLIAAGVAVAALGRRKLLVAWMASFALLGAAGLYDFWRWSYDYGHNLDVENAIIVVPGMTYQPPLIGTKQLLNFTATSLPHIGGILAGAAFVAGAAAVFLSFRRGRLSAVVGAAIFATACATGAPSLALGAACAECRMVIADARFGAALVTSTGKTVHFDSVDCLLEYMRGNPGVSSRQILVVDAATPKLLIPESDARFEVDGALRPPMGTIVSYARAAASDSAVTWTTLRQRQDVAHVR